MTQEDHYKQVSAGNFWSNNCIENESNGNKNKTLSVEQYLKKIPYLKDIINNLKRSVKWKIQLTIPINYISSRDNDEERLMYSKTDSTEIMINDKASELLKNFLIHFFIDIKLDWKHQWEVAILPLIVHIHCIINAIK